jgi:DNA-binding transcriptional ArsR family regulator
MTLHRTLKRAVTLQPSENSQRDDPRIDLLKELADPVRLRVVDHLGNVGPATVSELAAGLRVTMPQLSNHLRRLREAGLVRVERTGRHAIYTLADESLQALLPLLDRLTGRVTTRPPQPDPEPARTCYDHLAGRLGVGLYAALRERGALRDQPDGTVTVGDEAPLRALGVDPAAVGGDRRRFAFECFDAQQHAPHLAGAMGDALAEALEARGWIERGEGRAVRVTAAGERGLRDALGIAL